MESKISNINYYNEKKIIFLLSYSLPFIVAYISLPQQSKSTSSFMFFNNQNIDFCSRLRNDGVRKIINEIYADC